jgi:hypothetical protein
MKLTHIAEGATRLDEQAKEVVPFRRICQVAKFSSACKHSFGILQVEFSFMSLDILIQKPLVADLVTEQAADGIVVE